MLDDLTRALDQQAHDPRRDAVDVEELRALGVFITLEGSTGTYPLKIESLESRTQHKNGGLPRWLLVTVHPATEDAPERAVVWVADDYRAAFLKRFEDYLDDSKLKTEADPSRWATPEGNPANNALVANISAIRATVLADLWQSEGQHPTGRQWWELWLDNTDTALPLLREFARLRGLAVRERTLALGNRVVAWINASWDDLQPLPFTAVPLAEIRSPRFVDSIEDLSREEQDEYAEDLVARIRPAPLGSPVVCHLDTGVARTHRLLDASLVAEDLHDVIGTSGFDRQGHGTRMAGLALLGPLDDLLLSRDTVQLIHRLESVRILPNPGESPTDPLDYGTVTVQGVTLPEATATRSRVYCMPVSCRADSPGQPTLWSATVDALAVGTDVVRDSDQLTLLSRPSPDEARLILIAAGNVDDYDKDHLAACDTTTIDDPGQAWNALTVGAGTELCDVPDHPDYHGWDALARAGDLSPFSRTSLTFGAKWPIKPDICMEGGNLITDGAGQFEPHPIVSLRTTGLGNDLALDNANATSAATAQAARLAALAMHRYPGYWPETVRGLLTHAAEWTPTMRAAIDGAGKSKKARLQMLRRYGWGVPTEASVLSSTRQAVTLVSQDSFVPFEGRDFTMRTFRLHRLPWPSDDLEALGAADVRLKITLSYFVEPSAARRGWRQRYGYASHGLRFDLQGPLEPLRAFITRIGRDANDDEDGRTPPPSSDRWTVGSAQRNLGSLHQDIWEGSGADLARCGSLAVYPVGGWWKRNARKDRLDLPVRYALLVSLSTPEQDVDLYTPILNDLRIPIQTAITG